MILKDSILSEIRNLNRLKKHKEVISLYEKINKSSLINSQILIEISKAYLALGENRKSEEYSKKAISVDSSNAKAHLNMGNVMDSEGKIDKAITSYNTAINLDNNYTDALFNRSLAFYKIKDYRSAIEDIKKCLDINFKDWDAHSQLGNFYSELGDFKSALQEYNLSLKNKPGDINILYNRGTLLSRFSRFNEAKSDFDSILEKYPQNINALLNRSATLVELDELESALLDLEEASKINQELPIVVHNKGFIYFLLGEFEKALSAFIRVKELEPNYNQIDIKIKEVELLINQELKQEQPWPNLEFAYLNGHTLFDSFNNPNYKFPRFTEAIDRLERWLGKIKPFANLIKVENTSIEFSMRYELCKKILRDDLKFEIREFIESCWNAKNALVKDIRDTHGEKIAKNLEEELFTYNSVQLIQYIADSSKHYGLDEGYITNNYYRNLEPNFGKIYLRLINNGFPSKLKPTCNFVGNIIPEFKIDSVLSNYDGKWYHGFDTILLSMQIIDKDGKELKDALGLIHEYLDILDKLSIKYQKLPTIY